MTNKAVQLPLPYISKLSVKGKALWWAEGHCINKKARAMGNTKTDFSIQSTDAKKHSATPSGEERSRDVA